MYKRQDTYVDATYNRASSVTLSGRKNGKWFVAVSGSNAQVTNVTVNGVTKVIRSDPDAEASYTMTWIVDITDNTLNISAARIDNVTAYILSTA